MKWSDESRQIVPGERSARRADIDLSLGRALILVQFPHWVHLPIEPVASGGWDNRTFRLGDDMTVGDLAATIDQDAVTSVWNAALKAKWRGRPVWLHGDVSAGNLLVTRGGLRAVIDFGSMGVGDPTCDLVIAWTLFSGEGRDVFRTALPFDPGTWSRARGWALWKALITLAEERGSDSLEAADARHVLDAVIAEHQRQHA
jgi:aminoglycoside phosphotransferase (APT) family kinase protein